LLQPPVKPASQYPNFINPTQIHHSDRDGLQPVPPQTLLQLTLCEMANSTNLTTHSLPSPRQQLARSHAAQLLSNISIRPPLLRLAGKQDSPYQRMPPDHKRQYKTNYPSVFDKVDRNSSSSYKIVRGVVSSSSTKRVPSS
jgi:hypothetical protein